ncbi:MAG: IMP dehydrogenase [Candidatus Thermoplasmatota archaeon]|nr:IMP dehydrogenase [Candidatus Thermoplasmatota archaeon]MCL5731261.1 IMP dehydrogenase [Candidatus Thermoplasmatota archaeon]
MFAEKFSSIKEALTFDDVLLVPQKSPVDPVEIDVASSISRHIKVKIPIVSSPMDTVTEVEMAVAMAREGGIGIIHRNMTANNQAQMISKVKREESIKIRNVYTVEPETSIEEAREIMRSKNIAGLPVISNDKLVGIVTRRDIEYVGEGKKTVSEIMVKDVIYANDEIDIEDAKQILYKNRIEKLPLVDKNGRVVGLITAKDITTRKKFPNASRDEEGQLMVGAAVGPFDIDRAVTLERAGADLIVVDTAHAHNEKVMNSIKKMRKAVSVDIVAGNIATAEAADDLISLEVDGLRVGIGPGSICTTRIIAGIGIPQITAISDVADIASGSGVPVIADGGIRFSGDIVKAIAAGASAVMLGSLLAGTEESPGTEMIMNGRKYKAYRGMGSVGVIRGGVSDRYGKISGSKFVAEGVEGAVPYRGKVNEVLFQLVGGLKSGMGYTGSRDIESLKTNGRFIKITASGLRESHPHDIRIISEPPNYQMYQV